MKAFKSCVMVCIFVLSSVFLSAKTESWDTFSDQKVTKTTQALSSIIIVRTSDIQGKAINIYIDGEYVSSLLPGAYTQEAVCSGTHRIKVAYTNIKTRYKEKRSRGQSATFNAGKKHFYRIVSVGNKLQLRTLSEKEKETLLEKYPKKQKHTISRLNKKKCYQPSSTKKTSSSKGN